MHETNRLQQGKVESRQMGKENKRMAGQWQVKSEVSFWRSWSFGDPHDKKGPGKSTPGGRNNWRPGREVGMGVGCLWKRRKDHCWNPWKEVARMPGEAAN